MFRLLNASSNPGGASYLNRIGIGVFLAGVSTSLLSFRGDFERGLFGFLTTMTGVSTTGRALGRLCGVRCVNTVDTSGATLDTVSTDSGALSGDRVVPAALTGLCILTARVIPLAAEDGRERGMRVAAAADCGRDRKPEPTAANPSPL